MIKLNNANISGSDFDDINLSETRFNNVNLSNSTFSNINMSKVVFEDIYFADAEIRNAKCLDGMKIEGIPVKALLDAYRQLNGGDIPGDG